MGDAVPLAAYTGVVTIPGGATWQCNRGCKGFAFGCRSCATKTSVGTGVKRCRRCRWRCSFKHRFTSSFHLHRARSAVLHRGRGEFSSSIKTPKISPPCCGTHAGLIVRRPSLCPLLSPIPPPPHTHNTEFTEHSRSSTTLPRPLPRLSRLSQS